MMAPTRRSVLVTGANGCIGGAICKAFMNAGWRVLATDQATEALVPCDDYFSLELVRFCEDEDYRYGRLAALAAALPDGLDSLINNAALQVIAPVQQLSVEEWRDSLSINVTGPFILIQGLLANLRQRAGTVVNVTSIHAIETKPNFSAYATSKAALEGLTRALAVELGSEVQVNAIAPAAIATPMLEEGFKDKPAARQELDRYHPSGTIGSPDEVARLALFLSDKCGSFLNGTIIGLNGAIAARLHDPE